MEDLKEVCANTLAIPCTSAALIHSSSITELQDITVFNSTLPGPTRIHMIISDSTEIIMWHYWFLFHLSSKLGSLTTTTSLRLPLRLNNDNSSININFRTNHHHHHRYETRPTRAWDVFVLWNLGMFVFLFFFYNSTDKYLQVIPMTMLATNANANGLKTNGVSSPRVFFFLFGMFFFSIFFIFYWWLLGSTMNDNDAH